MMRFLLIASFKRLSCDSKQSLEPTAAAALPGCGGANCGCICGDGYVATLLLFTPLINTNHESIVIFLSISRTPQKFRNKMLSWHNQVTSLHTQPLHAVCVTPIINSCVTVIFKTTKAQPWLQPQSQHQPKLCHPMAVVTFTAVACLNQPQ